MRRVALLFAIDSYSRNVASRLYGPVRDARDLSTALRSPRGGSWPDAAVVTRLNADATWVEFTRVVRVLQRIGQAAPWGEVVLHLNGHGGETGFVFHDGEISYQRIGALLNLVPARLTLVWSDACMSGLAHGAFGGIGGIDKTASSASARMVAALRRACPGVRVITATDDTGLAPADRSFTQYVIAAMSIARPDRNDGVVSAGRLFSVARRDMRSEMGDQYPRPDSSGDLEDFPLAVSDAAAPFGWSAATVGWSRFVGTRRYVPVSVALTGRRFLPTTVAVTLDTILGSTAISNRVTTPGSDAATAEVTVWFERRLEYPGSRLRIEATDDDGRLVGRSWRHQLAAPGGALSAFL